MNCQKKLGIFIKISSTITYILYTNLLQIYIYKKTGFVDILSEEIFKCKLVPDSRQRSQQSKIGFVYNSKIKVAQ